MHVRMQNLSVTDLLYEKNEAYRQNIPEGQTTCRFKITNL